MRRRRFRSLRARLFLAFLAVTLVPLALVGAVSLGQSARAIDRLARDGLRDEAALAAVGLEKSVNAARSDLSFLAQLPSLRARVRAGAGGAGAVAGPDEAAGDDALAADLAAVVAPADRYAAAQWIGLDGRERVRVVRAKEAVQVVPRAALRDLAADPAVARALALPAGGLAIGMLETQDPLRPALGALVRLTAPVFDDAGVRRGAIGVDLRMQGVLEEVRRRGVTAERIVVIDPRGAYVEDPRLRGSAPLSPPWRDDLAARYPAIAAGAGRERAVVTGGIEATVLAVHPVEVGPAGVGPSAVGPSTVGPSAVVPAAGDAAAAGSWRVATVRPASALTTPVRDGIRLFALLLVLAGALASLLGRVVAGRLSRPLLRLARDAAELGRGRFDRPVAGAALGVAAGAPADEVETLASAMERMRRELEGLYRGLEERIAAKTAELTQANQALRAAYAELETAHRRLQASEAELVQSEKLSSLGRLAASVAHEINNPAGIVSLHAQLLREECDQPALRASVDRIVEAAERVSRIVRALLEATRRAPSAGETLPVRVADVVDEALASLRALGAAPRLAVEVDIEPESVTRGDPSQLAQVIRNLVENAAHATGGEGRLRVEARRRADAVEVSVSDDGPGIPAEALPRLFEPFFTTRRKTGTGLGLFVAWGIVRGHGGSIRAENRPEGGARFVVQLPLGAAAAAAAADTQYDDE